MFFVLNSFNFLKKIFFKNENINYFSMNTTTPFEMVAGCVCVCMYVCMYVWMACIIELSQWPFHERVYVCMYIYMYVCMYVWMYVWMHVCTYAWVACMMELLQRPFHDLLSNPLHESTRILENSVMQLENMRKYIKWVSEKHKTFKEKTTGSIFITGKQTKKQRIMGSLV